MRFGTINFNMENDEYTIIPNELFRNKNLSNDAKFFLINLLTYPVSDCEKGLEDEKLRLHTGYSQKKIDELFKELEKENYVKVVENISIHNTIMPYRIFHHSPIDTLKKEVA